MENHHKIIQISSHVTSLVGTVGIVGLCSCGWLGSAEGDNTRIATIALIDLWREDHGTEAAFGPR
jgi:hypothetical protein